MKLRHASVLGWLALFASLAAQAGPFKFPTQTLTVPDGFEVELAAGTYLVSRPIYACFDEQGRLYVADSSGSNEKPEQQLAHPTHRVVRLEATQGDGRFDQATVFADKLMFPEGCMWLDGSVYVATAPSIWKLTDTNNDGVADARVEWFQGKTLTGCANDLHGPFPGPDGWIYWCKGAFAEQTYERPGQKPFVTSAAHIFRSRPDNTGIEPVLTGGMDNPVGVAFTAGGERILCGTFFVQPAVGKRDGLIHAIYGGVYGKVHPVNDPHKKTGDLMPVMNLMGAAAPAAIIRYQSSGFGEEFRDNFFVCLFNLRKVARHALVPDGATFKAESIDFLTSDNPDFHPTDVVEDADGSLLVLDTGGWYKICCPTSQLSKPDLLGAIYRIRRVGAPKVDDPRGLKLAWEKMSPARLAALLDDARPAVRARALQQLARQGSAALAAADEVLKNGKSAEARRNAVWTLTRLDGPAARGAARQALDDADESVRHTALSSVSLWRDAGASEQLLRILRQENPPLQRVAAEALGRIGDAKAVPALLAASATPHDRVLEHSLIYALIEINNARSTAAGLSAGSPEARRAALIALDQMDDGKLQSDTVLPLLTAPDARLRQTAWWVAGHHGDWGGALTDFFRARLAATSLTEAERAELARQLAQFAHDPSIQNLLATTLAASSTIPTTRQLELRAMAEAGLKEAPPGWAPAVQACLTQGEEALVRPAVLTARTLGEIKKGAPDFSAALLVIARDDARPADLRLDALAALPRGLKTVEPSLLEFLLANLDPSKPVMIRSAAAGTLARARLSDEQLQDLAGRLKTVGPLELGRLLPAFEHSTTEATGLKLVAALKQAKGLSAVRPDALKSLLAKYPPAVREQGGELLVLLNVDEAKQKAHLDELQAALKDGDIRRGQAVFNSPKAACSACHSMGYAGGHVGPDLTSIGEARTQRDLIESVVYPSASFVRSYEPVIIATKADEEYSGVVRKDAPDEIVLATGPNTEVRIARADIVEMRPGRVSVMPAGLDEQLSRQELSDLIAFLKATKRGAN